jgi:hypothetical protein
MSGVKYGIWAGWALAIVLIAVLAAYIFLTAPVRRAGRLLKQLPGIEVGTTTLDQFQRQLQAAGLKASVSCQGGDCTFSERSEVRSISKFQFAPPTAILTSVSFKDGVSSEIYVWLEIQDHNTAGAMSPGTGATVHESALSRSCPEHFCTYVSDRSGYPWAVVEVDSAARKEDRARAFALNVGCLIKRGGCKRVGTILPQVFGKADS